ncbi:hypothetical protein RB195_019400 [Necator americanus]|uniref:Uncharacterized protein n=1 Tax=Necator americanus TaxID=51031 RepID=A0ABR1CDZ8_NECAM
MEKAGLAEDVAQARRRCPVTFLGVREEVKGETAWRQQRDITTRSHQHKDTIFAKSMADVTGMKKAVSAKVLQLFGSFAAAE